jgi:DNA gyrase/topoisomerase IV subunit B
MSRYDSDSIETLRGLETVRKNPAMYIGGTDGYGIFVCVRELLDNAADEYLAGRNKSVGVFIDKDNSYWVQDSGSGIPQGIKKFDVEVNGKTMTNTMPTMQAVFGELHTSGKFKSEAYKVSIGSHGVGVKGSNATAEYFEVWTCYQNQWFSIKFKKGKLTSPVKKDTAPLSPITGKRMTKGTLVHFRPDPTIFTVKSFPPSMLLEWSEVMSYLSPGFQIVLKVKDKTKVFLSKEGPKDYINLRLAKLEAIAEPDMFEFNNELVTVVAAFSNVDGFELRGFTNGLSNSQGGKHVDSVASGLYRAIKPYAAAKQTFTTHDFRDGVIGIVNAKLHKAQFSSQDKAKLTDPRMDKDFEETIFKEATSFFNKNKAMARRLCDRAARISDLKDKFKNNKAVVKALNDLKRHGMPANFAPAHKSVPIKDRELIILEGASAAGPLRQVRDKNQAILPLKGKILNVIRSTQTRALASKDVLNIMGALGYDPKAEDPLSKLQVGRVVQLADPDPDGHHINCLLQAFFMKYLPGMYERGMIFVADTPEFYSIVKDQIFVGDTLSEVQKKLDKAGLKGSVSHVKGWGEVDAQVVKKWAVDKDTRKLIQMKPLSPEDYKIFGALMGAADVDESEAKPVRATKAPPVKAPPAKAVPAKRVARKQTK